MVFSIREGVRGLNHLGLRVSRLLFKKPTTIYLERYASSNLSVEPALDQKGNFICCDVCGFILINTTLDQGWDLQMCSAFPIISLDDPKFRSWFQKLVEIDPRKNVPLNNNPHE